ncbi:MAG TPA: phosphate acyltransferase PlsX [Acidimicrobiales bacterium]|nr:phosphate acyltransferase PlsX [Acidimicrobiales bacterium]
MARGGSRPEGEAFAALPVAVDAMGGDKAPGEIVAGARRIAEAGDIGVLLVGVEGQMGDTGGLPLLYCTEVIGMDDDPGHGVRKKKDSSLVRAAEAVRDGQAMAMVSAGNTGATMASALLRMGRLPGVIRPAIATPIPDLKKAHPTVLLDSGANAETSVPMLIQFAQMGAAYSTARYGVRRPRVALLSIGEEKSKGTPLVKETHALLAEGGHGDFEFVGNVEGRDFFEDQADVIVTDGFTGNVALKTLEGTLRFLMSALTGILTLPEVADAAGVLFPHLLPLAARLDPEETGGAMLLGVDGVCVISHGSSTSVAMVNAITVAHDVAVAGLVAAVASSVRPPADDGSASTD